MDETRLTETHRLDLLKSGLDDRTIAEAAIRSVSPGEMVDRLGFTIDGVASMYEIPYCEGYSRYKVFYEAAVHVGDNGNSRPKYLSRKNGGNRLYIPTRSRNVLQTLVPLYVTEGEKKALKATQEGLPCIAIAGLWNWKSGEREGLIADFDAIAVSGRSVFIVPDNDWLKPDRHGEPKNLRQAVYELAYQLVDKGAHVHCGTPRG